MSQDKFEYLFEIQGINDIPIDLYEKDFTFIVDGEEIRTSRILADLLSPIIRQYHYIDNTINTFHITTHHRISNDTKERPFEIFLKHIKNHEKMNLREDEKEYLKEIFLLIGNEREYSKFEPEIKSPLSKENVFHRLHILQQFYSNFDQQLKNTKQIINNENHFKNELEFISSHFYEIDKEEVNKLDFNSLEFIINNEQLQIEDEDSLFEFILEKYKQDKLYSHFFEFIIYSNVSVDNMKQFIKFFELEDMNYNIWKIICDRLIKEIATESTKSAETIEKNRYHSKTKTKPKPNNQNSESSTQEIPYKEGNEFNGIIKYLTTKSGGNIVENGTISISSNTQANVSWPFKNIVDFSTDNYYDSQDNIQHHTVTFDFKSMRVKISNYSIKSPYKDPNSNYQMKSWVLESSNDGSSWKIIDRQDNCSSINGKLLTSTFKSTMNEFSRFIRYRQTDKNWGNDQYLTINSLEFYGSLQQ